MSGASGRVASVTHMTPEAKDAGVIAKIRSGDTIRLDIDEGSAIKSVSRIKIRGCRVMSQMTLTPPGNYDPLPDYSSNSDR